MRWPGWDGWLVGLVAVVLMSLQGIRRVEGMWAVVGVALAGAFLYLLFTRGLRRRRRTSYPVVSQRILTVIPTKDNAGTIADVVAGCLRHTADLLVIDDGSSDGSGELAREAGAEVVTHARNRGKGAALETALDWAAAHGFSHIVAIDADAQHEPDDLPSFFDAIQADPLAVLAGVRDMSDAPRGAVYARANSNFWVWVETSQRMGDTQCGYRAYPVESVRQLCLVPSRYQWEVEVLVRSVWAGIPVLDHPCRVFYPPAEERVSSYRKFVDTARISWLNAHLIAERLLWPPRWFPAKSTWKGSHRGFAAGWAAYLWLMKTVGRKPVQWALVPLVGFYWLFLGAQRKGVDAYLRRRFPEAGSVALAKYRFLLLKNFAWSIVDRFHVLLPVENELTLDRSAVPGLNEKLYGADVDQGFLMISGHLGNPDLAGLFLREKDKQVHLLLFKAPNDPYFELMLEKMGDAAPAIIAINDGAQLASLTAVKALRSGGIVASKGDRVVDGRVARVNFLGAPIDLPTGPLLLAALAKSPVIFAGCFRTEQDTYRFEVSGPHEFRFTSRSDRDADLQRWAAIWAGVLEEWTERHPLQWYNFFDPWAEAEARSAEV